MRAFHRRRQSGGSVLVVALWCALVALGVSLLPSAPGVATVYAQDLDCENDPLVRVPVINERNETIDVHLWFRASRQIAPGVILTPAEMLNHLDTRYHIVERETRAVRLRNAYLVQVVSWMESYRRDGRVINFRVSGGLSRTETDRPQRWDDAVTSPTARITSANKMVTRLLIPAPDRPDRPYSWDDD